MILALLVSILAAAGPIPSAEIIRSRQSYVLTDAENGKYNVEVTINVNDKNGEEFGEFLLYTDAFETLSSFSGTIIPSSGKAQTIKKKDLLTISLSNGLADDIVANTYVPNCPLPYTVSYSYTVTEKKGIISFPVFSPIEGEGVALKDAEYSLTVPSGYKILYNGNIEPEVTKEKKTDVYKWSVKDVEAIKTEHNMPRITELIPFCRIAPESFSFAGHPGNQKDWNSVGCWVSALNDEVSAIPDGLAKTVEELTSGIDDELEKVRILYDYLVRSTRYVSIQLGIGGYRPFPGKDVQKTGFGDCKALSNYMKLMLTAAGIKSTYIILSTSRPSMTGEFASVGYCNHAMLCVPLEHGRDTLWLECTSQTPVGFRHSGIAGHDVLLVDGENSRVVNVPDYNGKDRYKQDVLQVCLDEKGNASVKGMKTMRADMVESYFQIERNSDKQQQNILSDDITSRAENVRLIGKDDNFHLYDGSTFVPEVDIDYSFESPSFAGNSRDRLFVPISPIILSQGAQKASRIHDVCLYKDATREVHTVIAIPDGYSIENMPSSVELTCEFAVYRLDVETVEDESGTQIITTQHLSIKKGRYPASDYDQFRTFSKAIKKTASSSIVLVRE